MFNNATNVELGSQGRLADMVLWGGLARPIFNAIEDALVPGKVVAGGKNILSLDYRSIEAEVSISFTDGTIHVAAPSTTLLDVTNPAKQLLWGSESACNKVAIRIDKEGGQLEISALQKLNLLKVIAELASVFYTSEPLTPSPDIQAPGVAIWNNRHRLASQAVWAIALSAVSTSNDLTLILE